MSVKVRVFPYLAVATFMFAVNLTGSLVVSGQSKKEVLDRIDGNYKTVSSLMADLTMVKFSPQTEVTDLFTGTLKFLPEVAKPKRQMYFRIDWVKPNETILVIGDTYQIYREHDKTLIEGKRSGAKNSASAGNLLALVSMSRARMMADYDIDVDGRESLSDGTKTTHLILRPKIKMEAKRAEMWVDDNGMPRQVKVTQMNDDITTILLTKFQKNVVLKATDFQLVFRGKVDRVKG
jgi:outer membrane lipoprotein-sorting protein